MASRMKKKIAGVFLCGITGLVGVYLHQDDSTVDWTENDKRLAVGNDSQEESVPASKRVEPGSDPMEMLNSIRAAPVQELTRSETPEDSFKKHEYIVEHFRTVGDVRPGSESRYQASLKKLRDNPDSVTDLIDLFSHTDKTQWNRQWLIIETLGELDPIKGVDLFAAVLNRPSVVTTVPHGIPNIERMIQFSAVDQLVRASQEGSVHAQKILVELQDHPEPEVNVYLQKVNKI